MLHKKIDSNVTEKIEGIIDYKLVEHFSVNSVVSVQLVPFLVSEIFLKFMTAK